MGPSPLALPYATDWRFTIGNIGGELCAVFIPSFLRALNAFGTTFIDKDNRLCAVPDDLCVTSIQLKIQSLSLIMWNEKNCISLIFSKGVLLQSDNFVTLNWIDRTFIRIPSIEIQSLACIEDEQIWYEIMSFTTSIVMTKYKKDPTCEDILEQQKAYVKENDGFNKRCAELYKNRDSNPIREEYDNRFLFYNYNPPFNFIDEAPKSAPSFFDFGIDPSSNDAY